MKQFPDVVKRSFQVNPSKSLRSPQSILVYIPQIWPELTASTCCIEWRYSLILTLNLMGAIGICLNHWKHLINSCCTDYHIKRHKQIGTPEFCFQSSVYTCICTISSIIRLNQWSFFPKTMKYLIDLNIQMCWFFVFLMYAVNPTIFFPNSQN